MKYVFDGLVRVPKDVRIVIENETGRSYRRSYGKDFVVVEHELRIELDWQEIRAALNEVVFELGDVETIRLRLPEVERLIKQLEEFVAFCREAESEGGA